MGNIDWLPIADMPEEMKDGRRVLLAEFQERGTANPGPGEWSLSIARWVTWLSPEGYWDDGLDEDRHISDFGLHPTLWAELTEPTAADPGIPVYKVRDATDDVLGATLPKD